MSDEFKIEKNVPPPNGNNIKYPWAELEVGDSFVVRETKSTSVAGVASAAGKRLGFKFVTKSVDGGVRVWRIK